MTRSRSFAATLLALALAAAPVTAAAQQPAEQPPPNSPAPIVVIGPLNPDELPVKAGSVTGMGSVSRSLGEEAARFQRCATTARPHELRDILDNGPKHRRAQQALHRYIIRNQVCYMGYPYPPPPSPYLGDCNPQIHEPLPVCRSVFDRGALFERAIEKFAADVDLTRMMTFDPATRARFLRRSLERGELSDYLDRQYFSVVGCMVQISPGWARRLLAAEPGSAEETQARRVIVGYGSPCVGNAAKVQADPAQFRAYTAEALYIWIASALGRQSLVAG